MIKFSKTLGVMQPLFALESVIQTRVLSTEIFIKQLLHFLKSYNKNRNCNKIYKTSPMLLQKTWDSISMKV